MRLISNAILLFELHFSNNLESLEAFYLKGLVLLVVIDTKSNLSFSISDCVMWFSSFFASKFCVSFGRFILC